MQSEHQRLNVAVPKIPVGGWFDILQVRGVLDRTREEPRFHDQDDTSGRTRPGEAIAGSCRQDVDRPRTIVCVAALALCGPLRLDISMGKKIQEMSRMIMIRNRDAGHIAERFQGNAVPPPTAAT